MNKYLYLLFAVFTISTIQAQTPFKQVPPAVPTALNVEALDFRGDLIPKSTNQDKKKLDEYNLTPLTITSVAGVRVLRDGETGEVYALRGRPAALTPGSATKEDAYAYLELLAANLGLSDTRNEVVITQEETDALGQVHLRLEQRYQGVPVYPADGRLHATGGNGFDLFTGRFAPTPIGLEVVPTITEFGARSQVQGEVQEQWIDLPAEQLDWISGPQLEAKLIVYTPAGQTPVLAWMVDARPNLMTHEVHLINAHTGEQISVHSHLCGMRHTNEAGAVESLNTAPSSAHCTSDRAHEIKNKPIKHNREQTTALPPDGAYTTTLPNLFDQNETINTFVLQDTFYLLDGSREMFTTADGVIDGFLLTYDGFGGTPQRQDFNPGIAISLTNEDWTPTAVSVHANAGAAYQYFFDRFARNSIDGNGGSVYSFMNINETDGTQMDNAFWNGRALFYGNGSQAFNRLPRALDVAGHEMAHGVIQSTANLVYELQPGAMNESFADIFGYLVEGETGDYRIGEDVVRTNVFTSGAMRNLQDPNNGASGPSDFRWQPAHMDEFRTLPNTPAGDNGGVHINSGIPNRAFYLFSSNPDVGDARAEQVYYRALTVYLTRSSRFEDLRLAVVQAADDLFNANVVAAANAAFDGVGIGGGDGTGTDTTVDLETNDGDRFILVADAAQQRLFHTDEDGTNLVGPIVETGILSRPSITDDGTAAVFIDDQNRIRVLNLITDELSFLEGSPQTIWRNVAVSKDGSRLAVTTTDNDNTILIFNLENSSGLTMELFNPTTASGISTGDVQYADALEWDPAGEFLMYDALSRLDDGLEFWDIGFLRAWDNDAGDFGDGNIFKLVNTLPEDISIGNPTFSKNSPYIIAFEEVDFAAGTFTLTGANIETGDTETIFTNGKVNYPAYGIDDDRVCFDADDTNNQAILAVRSVADDKISPAGNATILIPGGHWGQYYATGTRDLDTAIDGPVVKDNRVKVFPTVTENFVTIEAPALLHAANVQVLDVNGRLLLTRPLTNGQLALGSLAAGTYLVAIPVTEGTVIRRVIVR